MSTRGITTMCVIPVSVLYQSVFSVPVSVSMTRSRVRVLITMLSYEYTWYNWLVPCQKKLKSTLFSKDLAKQDRYTLFGSP